MGINVEFNPDLALRSISQYHSGARSLDECIPEPLEEGQTYPFLKKGQRCYYLLEPIPLLETQGNQQLSRPLASITILEAIHHLLDGEVWTRGTYLVHSIYDPQDPTIHFEGMQPLDNN